MKSQRIIAIVFTALLLTVSCAFSNKGPKWERLGTRTGDWKMDHDEILVTGFEGKFSALKVKVLQGSLNMHKMVVHFRNGGTQDIDLRNTFKPGSHSRVINLDGDDRVIRKVEFWYDAKNHSKKSVVQLWGKH